MLLRYRLIHIRIITMKQFFYLLYLRPCLDLGLFMSYLCDLLLIFIFIMIKSLMPGGNKKVTHS